ncbi:hypothetical protein EN962_28540, partial [Mesorhizobium sp. M7A.F.Ca.CA.001.09.2.1]
MMNSIPMSEAAPSSGRFAATFFPLGRRGWRQRWQAPLPVGERSAEQSGGWGRGSAGFRDWSLPTIAAWRAL